MAGRASRGRGRGRASREDFWNEQNWWNLNFPPQPGFPPPQFPPVYGFYPQPPPPPHAVTSTMASVSWSAPGSDAQSAVV
jgi:hypothetical protein